MAQNQPKEFEEKVIEINRVSKKTKGGNKMGFTALVAVGDKKGRVGVAQGKANDVLSAIQKGVRRAKKRMITIPLKDSTLPHTIRIKTGAAIVLLKPAPEGTGVIAGGAVRSVLELAGVRNVVSKILGTNNKLSNVSATFDALKRMDRTMKVKKVTLGADHPSVITKSKKAEKKVEKTETQTKKAPTKAQKTKKESVKKAPKTAKKATKEAKKQVKTTTKRQTKASPKKPAVKKKAVKGKK